jgi:hypothetical protein
VTEIRSYRRVFDLERRIYSVDRLRLNPGGVPVRGVVYFLAILAAAMLVGGLPMLGTIAQQAPWFLRDIALPVAAAAVLTAIRIEGRVFHLAAHAVLRYRFGPRHLAGTRRCARFGERWSPQEIVILPDGSDARLRPLVYRGPGAVLVSVEHGRGGRATERGAIGRVRLGVGTALSLNQVVDARPLEERQVISLASGARLRVRSSNPWRAR